MTAKAIHLRLKNKMKLNIRETAVFAMLGALIFASKILMEALPNIHLICTFIIAVTVVYRQKALYPIYTFIFIEGIVSGFALWWIPYLYIWAVPWAVTMLLPKKISPKLQTIIYSVVCSLHGFLYGTLYAPAQALLFGLDFKGMISWIIAGLPYDAIHGISNFFCGLLIVPIIKALRVADKGINKNYNKI